MKGNICPLCQRLYGDDEYDTPMFCCEKCERWLHAKCINSSLATDREPYDLISSLCPPDVSYFCPDCCRLSEEPLPDYPAVLKATMNAFQALLASLLDEMKTWPEFAAFQHWSDGEGTVVAGGKQPLVPDATKEIAAS